MEKTKDLFKYIKANQFFKYYAPEVNNFKHKIRGISGNRKKLNFSNTDKEYIKLGLLQMLSEFKKIQ